ncbi:hypothetical protein DK926_19430 [Rhodococcus sp. Eu-32]|uniref:hypothetical protein n=1 Tax=Rhodococcus sp. Eu-32 TaxID=1017319 RepID=UPI000DF144CB|nr:hypothetical protein [Rhodococcus sp. Eu-32]RRQ26172.1 hypothetical protein DK926_19430 [Rhodococcus sp. Eu-32]
MTDDNNTSTTDRQVGDTVQLRRGDEAAVAGKIVEDFGDQSTVHDGLGRDWATPRRWAVALHSGTLVFADDDELT